MCETDVSPAMSTDGDAGEVQMEELCIEVPASLLEEIDEEWERRGYASKPEAIRDALRDWVNPPVTLSAETLDDLEESRKQAERGETYSLDEATERLRDDKK